MSISSICTTNVISIDSQAGIYEAAKVMKENNIGDVVVTEKGMVKGILTDRDIVIKIAADHVDLDAVKVADVMNGSQDNLLVIQPEQGIAETIVALRDRGVRRAPIVDKNGKAVGIATLDDLFIFITNELKGLSDVIEKQTHA